MRLHPSEHYDQAERLLEESKATDPDHAMYLVAAAQVHATLAAVPTRPHSVTVPVRYPDQAETP